MSSPMIKRRRLDATSNALRKPFRSPLKTPLAANTTNISVQKLCEAPDVVQHRYHDSTRILEPTKLQPQPAVMPSRNKADRNLFSFPFPSIAIDVDPDIAALIRTQRQLERDLRQLKEDLDMAEQARRIEMDSEKRNPGGPTDGELLQLLGKWRTASRQAAEELFTIARDRVNRMGGPKAWKDMEERQKEFRRGWDTEPQLLDSEDENGQDKEGKDASTEYSIDLENVLEKEARGGKEILVDEEAEDEFTMAMMLRSLNVPLSTIGYDRENQRWAD